MDGPSHLTTSPRRTSKSQKDDQLRRTMRTLGFRPHSRSSLSATLGLAAAFVATTAADAPVAAQEGTIAYTHTLEVEIPEDMRARFEARGARGDRPGGPGGPGGPPSSRTSEVLLLFDAGASLMKPVPREIRTERPGGPGGDRGQAFQRRMRQRSAARGDRETLVEAYTDLTTGTTVEARTFLTRTFLIEGERPQYAWSLRSEQAEFLGYVVQKATAVDGETTIEAWFTPQIPVMGGPAHFGGLPGMILVISVDGGREQYSATAVSLSEVADELIAEPTEGEAYTRADYEQMVADKLEELRLTRGG